MERSTMEQVLEKMLVTKLMTAELGQLLEDSVGNAPAVRARMKDGLSNYFGSGLAEESDVASIFTVFGEPVLARQGTARSSIVPIAFLGGIMLTLENPKVAGDFYRAFMGRLMEMEARPDMAAELKAASSHDYKTTDVLKCSHQLAAMLVEVLMELHKEALEVEA